MMMVDYYMMFMSVPLSVQLLVSGEQWLNPQNLLSGIVAPGTLILSNSVSVVQNNQPIIHCY
jgi:hypothetical protein